MGDQKLKVGFSMLTYSLRADQNYEHDVDFLRKLSELADVHLIVERGQEAPSLDLPTIYVQRSRSRLMLILEHFWMLLQLRFKGVRVFYSRNSLMNAVLAGLVSRLTGGAAYLWSCGEIRRGREATKKEKGLVYYLLEISAYFLAFRLVKGLVTGTNAMKEYYATELSIPRKKIFVLPNWVDLARFDSGENARQDRRRELDIPGDAFVLLFPRSLSERHGTRLLPDMLKLLRQRGINAYLIASGRGQYYSWLYERVGENGTAEYLRILGGVPNLEMPDLFAASDVSILPSQTEGFPRVMLESMALGTPFVAHAVGGVTDVVSSEQRELIVPVGELDKFVDVLERLQVDPVWRDDMTEAGYKRVEEFDVSPVVAAFARLFKTGRSSFQAMDAG